MAAGPVVAVTLWDPERSDRVLLDDVARALRGAGATVTPLLGASVPTVQVGGYDALGAAAEPVAARAARPGSGPGGLVQVDVPWFHFDVLRAEGGGAAGAAELRTRREAAFEAAVERLAGEVRPLLAVWPAEFPVDTLPALDPDESPYLLRAGWVDPDRLEPDRRAALDGVLGAAREDRAGGWWWTGGDHDLGGAVGAALAGRRIPAPAPAAPPLPEIPPAPQLWFWAADRDDAQLLADVRAWAGEEGLAADRVWLDAADAPGWAPAVVELGRPDLRREDLPAVLRSGLGLLRRGAGRVRPSWVALLPDDGQLVPGAVAEPATAVQRTVWVSRAWIPADELAELDDAVRGAYREEVADGVLLVTDPLAADGVAGWAADPELWWPRALAAAGVLSRVARGSRTGPGGVAGPAG